MFKTKSKYLNNENLLSLNAEVVSKGLTKRIQSCSMEYLRGLEEEMNLILFQIEIYWEEMLLFLLNWFI